MEMTFEYWAKRWLSVSAYEVKETTHNEYVGGIRQLIIKFGDISIHELTPKFIQDYLNELFLNGKSKSTINKKKYLIQQIYRYINLQGVSVPSPCALVKAPRMATQNTRRSLTEDEIKKIILNRYVKPFGFYAFCLLFLGLRRSEMMALCWEDIDFERELLHINKVVVYLNSKPTLNYVLKNGWREREIPIPDLLLFELKQCVISEGSSIQKKGFIFSDHPGKLMNENSINRRWAIYRDAAELPNITQHMVRHTYATLLHDANIDVKAAAALMGHRDERTTLIVYTHINKEKEAKKAVQQLNGYISEAFGNSSTTGNTSL